MDRKDFINLMKEIGTNDKLLEMPGIMEPIYLKLKDKSESEIRNTKSLLILKSGGISFEDVDYFLAADGERAKIVKGDKEIEVNKFGIQVSMNSGDGSTFYSYMKRKNGVIECVSQNHSVFTRRCYLDNGNCLIENACGERVNASLFGKAEIEGEEVDKIRLDKESIMKEFVRNAKAVIMEYPNTQPYYSRTQEQLLSNINLQNNPVRKMQRTIDRLKAENDALRSKNEKLIKKLHSANMFIEGVKKNPASKFLFKRQLDDVEVTNRMYK